MNFFNKLELKYRKYAVPNLMTYLTALYACGFVMSYLAPTLYYRYLALSAPMILRGQVWRLVTWLIYPPSSSMLFGLLMLYLYYNLGNHLERLWGSFRFNVFIFSGILFHILAAFVLYAIFGQAAGTILLTPNNLNLTIFLAFVCCFPDAQFLLFFVLPVKGWYLGVFYAVMLALTFFTSGIAVKIEIFLSLLNFILFFLVTGRLDGLVQRVKQWNRRRKWKGR